MRLQVGKKPEKHQHLEILAVSGSETEQTEDDLLFVEENKRHSSRKSEEFLQRLIQNHLHNHFLSLFILYYFSVHVCDSYRKLIGQVFIEHVRKY